MELSDLDAACAVDGKLKVQVEDVALGTKFAYHYLMEDMSLKKRREFSLDEWLPTEIQKRALTAMSLCDGMAWVEVVKEQAEREVREWIQTNPRLQKPQ